MSHGPGHWVRVTLASVAEHSLGKMLDRSKHTTGRRLPYLRNINVRWGRIDTEDVLEMPFRETEHQRFGLEEGDLLVCEGGEPGRCAIWDGRIPEMKFQKALHRVRVSQALEPKFLRYRLEFDASSGALSSYFTGTTIKHLTARSLAKYAFHLPPEGEQRRIVSKIEELTERSRRANESLDAISPLLERFRESILAAAFRGDLTADWRAQNPDVEPADQLLERILAERRLRWEEDFIAKEHAKGKRLKGDGWKTKYQAPRIDSARRTAGIPENWSMAALEMLTCPVRVIRYGILKPGPEVPGGVRFVKVKHFSSGVLDTSALPRTSQQISDKYKAALLERGDILLSIRGTYGRVVDVPDSLAGANITQDSARIAPVPGVDRGYLRSVLQSPQIQAHFQSIAKGVAVKGLNIRDIRPTVVPLPPLPEQLEIARRVDAAFALISAVDEQVTEAGAKATRIDQAILAKAFRGELVPQDPNDEPASALLERLRAEAPPKKKRASSRSRRS